MRLLFLALAICAMLLAGCTASLPLDATGAGSGSAPRQSSWDPLAPSFTVPTLHSALASAPALRCGVFSVTALNHRNAPDTQVLAALRLKQTADGLEIRSARRLTEAALYVRYDGAQWHLSMAQMERRDGVTYALEAGNGLVACGVAALGQGSLDPRLPLAVLHFAGGPAQSVRAVSKITQDTRSAVTDLSAAGEGSDKATLSWLERHTGDYDQNGEVNISDLTPIGAHFQVSYTPASPDYAKLEVVDGDGNGEINISDITPIGANFQSFLSGYDIYRTPLATPDEIPDPADTGRWTKVPNATAPSGPSAPRDYSGQDFRLPYTFLDNCGVGDFGWYVVPVNYSGTPEAGPQSNVATVALAPPAASISFLIEPPKGPLLNLNDEFYLAIVVSNVTGLFSANVRFEYDSTLVTYMEGVSAYNDGTDHPNLLEPPLFLAGDDVGAADSPYKLVGFNATQTAGTPAKDGAGVLGYIKFKATGGGLVNPTCFRFPQSTSFIYLWGTTYGVPIADPVLGDPQIVNIGT